ncbi:unnamed protein product [Leptosia nina]|uniref:BESS domain-containing protein n=1 Tax=Leptosia nina TaxID=320188 RepID=A0AAV1K2U8_9NEOP
MGSIGHAGQCRFHLKRKISDVKSLKILFCAHWKKFPKVLKLKVLRRNMTYRDLTFKDEEEKISEYLVTSFKLNHGLSKLKTHELVYEYATAIKKNPDNWTEKKLASKDWLRGFFKRQPQLSIRTPEATSLSQATSFNKKNVGDFFENLKTVYERHPFGPESIYDIDESGLSTVQRTQKVIALRGTKQVGQVTSAERAAVLMHWMVSNPAKTVTIYEIPKLAAKAIPLAFKLQNIQSGFEKSGIWPFNSNIFSDEDFACSSITDRCLPEESNVPSEQTILDQPVTEQPSTGENQSLEDGTSSNVGVIGPSQLESPSRSQISGTVNVTPDVVRPYPKAGPRKLQGMKRKKGKTRILTDTPEKRLIEMEEQERQRKNKIKLNKNNSFINIYNYQAISAINNDDDERSSTPQSIAGASSSTQYTSTKRKCAQDVRQEFMELEKKKLELLQLKLSQSSKQHEQDCEDLLSYKSLLPYMKELSPMQKLRARNNITQVIMDEMNSGMTQSHHGYNTYDYNTTNYGN